MLKKFVLWGHHLSDYCEMFDLLEQDLADKKIIEYGAGATSFNAQMHAKGRAVVSVDPLYALPFDELKETVQDVFDTTVSKIKNNKDKYNWKNYGDLTALLEQRQQGIEQFLADFEQGKQQGRYVSQLDNLQDYSFDLALITHHLFVNYGDKGASEHVALILEMIRVAGEVRTFPLLNKYGQVSQLLGPVMQILQQKDIALEVRQVASQLQKAGNAMLRAWAVKCDVSES